MFGLKFLLLTTISLQLSTCTLAQSEVTDEAQKSLDLLLAQLEDNIRKIPDESLHLWFLYNNSISTQLDERLRNDTANFRVTLGNVSAIAVNVDGGRECIQLLLNSSGFIDNIFSSEQLIFDYVYNLALTDHFNIANQYNSLKAQFNANCVEAQKNCEATSRAIAAEVERLLPGARRIGLDLLTEVDLLGYQLGTNLENARAELMEIYNKAIQNTTLCVISKIKSSKPDYPNEIPSGSIFELLSEFIRVTESAISSAIIDTLTHQQEVILQSTDDYLDSIRGVSIVYTRANETLRGLTDAARDYNVTLNCTSLDLFPIVNASIQKVLEEFRLLEKSLTREYERGIDSINSTTRIMHSLTLEIQGCGLESCDYLAEKLVSKQIEVPWQLQQITNATIVSLQQTITAVRESGARIARDLEEELEVRLITFKSCVQKSF